VTEEWRDETHRGGRGGGGGGNSRVLQNIQVQEDQLKPRSQVSPSMWRTWQGKQ